MCGRTASEAELVPQAADIEGRSRGSYVTVIGLADAPRAETLRMPLSRRHLLIAPFALSAAAEAAAGAKSSAEVITLLKQLGHVAFMRHAWAPFEGAPKEGGRDVETLGPCETQRNLDDFGRNDARRIGNVFRKEGVIFERVFSSVWCRCRETAELIMGRPVENLPLINSYFTSPLKAAKGPAQLAALKRYLNESLEPAERVLFVTHGSLITDLAGIDTGETEMVVIKADRAGGISLVGHGVV
jgi:phosphohistidine phosphatase SixA